MQLFNKMGQFSPALNVFSMFGQEIKLYKNTKYHNEFEITKCRPTFTKGRTRQGFFSRLGKNTGWQRYIRFPKIPEIPAKIPANTDRNLPTEVLN
jgi:hypothetical protein